LISPLPAASRGPLLGHEIENTYPAVLHPTGANRVCCDARISCRTASMSDYDFDLFVIGAGSGGVRASRMAASFGARVAVAEELYLGGTCVNVGCVPKKLFAYAAHFAEDFADARGYGWDLAVASFTWQRLLDNKNAEITRLN